MPTSRLSTATTGRARLGRAVLVTGGTRGIGRAVARAFADNGDRVAVHHRGTREDGRDLAAELLVELGDDHVAVRAELTDPAQVAAMVDETADRLGGLDVLVNCAGTAQPQHPLPGTSYDRWQQAWADVLAVNLVAPANLVWCAVQHMGRGGRIVNVSSRGAFRGEPTRPAYAASKAGLNALGQSLAVALAPLGIAVVSVAPGYVERDDSNVHRKTERGPQVRAESPFDRVARPEEVAAAVLWLASPEAEWPSGAVLDLNGASYLRT